MNKKIVLLFILLTLAMPGHFVLAKVKLDVPFSSQAPYADWSEPWQNACEEIAMVMVDYYYQDKWLTKARARDEALSIFEFKDNTFGPSQSQNADEIIELINAYYSNWGAYRVDNPTIEQIKNEIDQGHPVIVPAYGRGLGNPNFTQPGPMYHILVIKGYDDEKQQFITNDQGTRKGENYVYSYQTIMTNIHDYLPNDRTIEGDKVVIFTKPEDINKEVKEIEAENEPTIVVSSEPETVGPEIAVDSASADYQVESKPVVNGEAQVEPAQTKGFWDWISSLWQWFISLFN